MNRVAITSCVALGNDRFLEPPWRSQGPCEGQEPRRMSASGRHAGDAHGDQESCRIFGPGLNSHHGAFSSYVNQRDIIDSRTS